MALSDRVGHRPEIRVLAIARSGGGPIGEPAEASGTVGIDPDSAGTHRRGDQDVEHGRRAGVGAGEVVVPRPNSNARFTA